jgi:hypothetical protein
MTKAREAAQTRKDAVFLFGSRVHGPAERSADVDLGFDGMSPEAFRCVVRALGEGVNHLFLLATGAGRGWIVHHNADVRHHIP